MLKIEEIEYSYTNESKVVATQQMQRLEANEVFRKFVVPAYSNYVQQRFKFQMQKAIQYSILENDEDILSSQLSSKKVLNWSIGNPDRKLRYRVT